ncbi:MAG: PhzF family phenazine biosynthesis protein [Acidiferrobacterales bacterium]|nr:PhzF family phenazine biosynthesis protein [Acidiferrobacterales bacterium]
MELAIYQVDAFADNVFTGNPAAVVPLDEWLEDDVMQSIAAEINLAETAFFVANKDRYQIRWFTPVIEVDLCGHATLASAFVLFSELNYSSKMITFDSKSGPLQVQKIERKELEKQLIELDFPCQKQIPCDAPKGLSDALGVDINECLKDDVYLVVLDREEQVANLKPNFSKLLEVDVRGVIVSAPSQAYDFVNRCFAPAVGINEDSVTGSAFTRLIPYWADRLNKNELFAKQISRRGGEVYCELKGNRVKIAGTATKFMQGTITFPLAMRKAIDDD